MRPIRIRCEIGTIELYTSYQLTLHFSLPKYTNSMKLSSIFKKAALVVFAFSAISCTRYIPVRNPGFVQATAGAPVGSPPSGGLVQTCGPSGPGRMADCDPSGCAPGGGLVQTGGPADHSKGGRMVQTGGQSVKRSSPPQFDGFTAITYDYKIVNGKKVITGRRVAQVGKDDPGLLKEGNNVYKDKRVHFHNGQVVEGGDIFQSNELDQIMAARKAKGYDRGPSQAPPAPPRRR